LRESDQKLEWGQVERIGKGTKASYDSEKKVLTFCFNRGPNTSSELLRASRELLMKELRELGYISRMKYNGEVVVDCVQESDVVLVKKNHKLMIRLNKKQALEKAKSASELLDSKVESQSRIKFS
jgi:hypothetical protein